MNRPKQPGRRAPQQPPAGKRPQRPATSSKGMMKRMVNIFRLIMVALLIILVYTIVSNQYEIYQKQQIERRLEEQIQELQQKNAELEQTKTSLGQPEQVEKIAREELGLVKPGEVPYVH